MFARMTSLRARKDRMNKIEEIFQNSIVPAAKSQKGYCGAYLLVDRETSKVVAITLWEKEEDAIANEENHYYQEQLIKVMNFIEGTFIREGFEVSVQT